MAAEIVIDAALFMGMHAAEESARLACKSFFTSNLATPMLMPLEQVGLCDDLIWRLPRDTQDAYYPFMDNLHSLLCVERPGYGRGDAEIGFGSAALDGLPDHERLLLGFVLRKGGTLHTASPRLTGRTGLPVRGIETPGADRAFPKTLETLYEQSLKLTVPAADL
ncbi:DUF6190 family protein [Phytomonospora endophytica]|uniref:Uncharacterized protein n=1 Tax=Phytomonospora endophytica TaxID=714109 RepID=A0A841G277_9ACTN|nr:DUF6190 family protein [Phytomonospora endophytica]MBB6038250.1 hypothetical protein [Phytomonospora endophytica]GIG67290.1 hypothetical protein Pen01_35850 [Phytomonospora endophytica]